MNRQPRPSIPRPRTKTDDMVECRSPFQQPVRCPTEIVHHRRAETRATTSLLQSRLSEPNVVTTARHRFGPTEAKLPWAIGAGWFWLPSAVWSCHEHEVPDFRTLEGIASLKACVGRS